MEDQIAELAAQIAELQASSGTTNRMFAETYYYLTIPLMIIIHAGFLAYEMGASRMKTCSHPTLKTFSLSPMIPTFYFLMVGLLGLSHRLLSMGPMEISGAEYASAIAFGWGEAAQYMGPNIAIGMSVFFGAFALFACTTASIVRRRYRTHTNRRLYHSCHRTGLLCVGRCSGMGLARGWLACHRLGRA